MAQGNPKGGGSLEAQINALKQSVGRDGIKLAAEILETYEPDVIKLAFKQVPKGPSATSGLGKRIENLLANVPKRRQAEVREALETAKVTAAG